MFESITMFTIDGTDYLEFKDGEVIIHRLDQSDTLVEAPSIDNNEWHWLLGNDG